MEERKARPDLGVDDVVDDAAEPRGGDALVEPLLGAQFTGLVRQQADAEEQDTLDRPADDPVLVPEPG